MRPRRCFVSDLLVALHADLPGVISMRGMNKQHGSERSAIRVGVGRSVSLVPKRGAGDCRYVVVFVLESSEFTIQVFGERRILWEKRKGCWH